MENRDENVNMSSGVGRDETGRKLAARKEAFEELKARRAEGGLPGRGAVGVVDGGKGEVARIRGYVKENKLICMDLKMSGSVEADRDRLGRAVNEVKGCVGAPGIVPELAEFQNVYEKKNPSTMRVEGVGQRIYFPEENMDMWREVLLCYDVNESVVDAEMYAGQVTIEFEER